MAETQEALTEIQKLSPHACILGFSQTRIWRYLIVAIVVHAIVIPLTSVGYIYHKVNPKAAEEAKAKREQERQAAAEQEQAATLDTGGAATEKPEAKTPTGGEGDAVVSGSAETATDREKALLEKHKDAPVIQRITETAKPDEIPKEPDGLGISIDDTTID